MDKPGRGSAVRAAAPPSVRKLTPEESLTGGQLPGQKKSGRRVSPNTRRPFREGGVACHPPLLTRIGGG